MLVPLKKYFFIFIFNLALFMILMIGIQNSANQRKVNLVLIETIKLPVSFIIGISFISGSISGGFLTTSFNIKN
tara:strand:+ start:733 stop:954 length:222 start_codon:yes stop_codon:yes gene_type:complete